MKHSTQHAYRQQGIMLLEALISILIFSIGILAIIGLQANSIKLANDSKYRADANLLANQIIGEMWLSQSSVASAVFATSFQSPNGASYVAWASKVASAIPTTGVSAPTVSIAQSSLAITGGSPVVTSTATIDIYWTVPGETASGTSTHHYQTLTQFNN